MDLLRGLVTTSDSVERAQREAGDGGGQRVRIGLYCFTESGDLMGMKRVETEPCKPAPKTPRSLIRRPGPHFSLLP